MDAVRLAFGTLTRLPVRPPGAVTSRVAQPAMLLAPVTVLPLAIVWVLVAVLVESGWFTALLAAALALAATAAWSRGLHLDGLSDTADGLAASYDRDRALEVMRRGNVGPTGASTLVLTLLVQVTALAALLTSTAGATLAVVALVASRGAIPLGCWTRVPAARSSGLGAAVGRSVSSAALAVEKVVLLAVALLASIALTPWWYGGPLVVIGALLTATAVLTIATRRLGGMTGDVLGASVELALAAALTTGAILVTAS